MPSPRIRGQPRSPSGKPVQDSQGFRICLQVRHDADHKDLYSMVRKRGPNLISAFISVTGFAVH